jgi:hypothetical protein
VLRHRRYFLLKPSPEFVAWDVPRLKGAQFEEFASARLMRTTPDGSAATS